MDSGHLSQSLDKVVRDTLPGLSSVRYISGEGCLACAVRLLTRTLGAAASLALWDHVVTAGPDFRIIWSQRLCFTKAVFLVIRWGSSIAVIFAAYCNPIYIRAEEDSDYFLAWSGFGGNYRMVSSSAD